MKNKVNDLRENCVIVATPSTDVLSQHEELTSQVDLDRQYSY